MNLKLHNLTYTTDGHRVILAQNGEEAWRMFSEQVPDLVLLDVHMPGVGGYETCTKVRRTVAGKRTPILMLTASNDIDAVARAYDAGATDFQTKPVSWRVLRERIRYILRAKRDADELTQLAQFDGVTGLLNRTAFGDRLERGLRVAKAEDQQLAVIFLDLDGFKEINDTFGHGFGDEILRLTAERLDQGLRLDDTLARPEPHDDAPVTARFGGDEFTIYLSDIRNVEAASAVADRIRDNLATPFRVQGHEVFVTASTGVSVYPFDGSDADTLLKHADAAMYDAKALGRNNHAPYSPSMSTKVAEKLSLAGDLRRALEREEFRVHFQPQIDVSSLRISGAEALIRWYHPERGWLNPLEFIELGEEIGIGGQIGEWLLRTTLSHIADWHRSEAPPPPIALNLSNSQFHDRGFLDRLTDAISKHGLDAGCIEIEVTENVIVRDQEAARDLLARFNAVGIRTAIDDFGTGQSALSTLTNLAVDTVKVDRSFIKNLGVSQKGRAVTASIIDIGHHLGLTVIAEGVETEEQLIMLESMGCDKAQGFFFSRAVPPAEFEILLKEGCLRKTESSGSR